MPRQASQRPGEGRRRVSLTATCLAWCLAASPEAARGCWLPPGRPPSAQPGSPPSLRTEEDFGKDASVQPDRLHPLRALRDEAGAGAAGLAGGRAVRPAASSHEKICRYIATESESVAVSVGYRLAPEHKYPAAYEDCLNATIHFMKNTEHYGVDPANKEMGGQWCSGDPVPP
ncbi:arylacetamide deacetylase-like 4 family member 1 isoform 2-T2 [Ciconia maguari]